MTARMVHIVDHSLKAVDGEPIRCCLQHDTAVPRYCTDLCAAFHGSAEPGLLVCLMMPGCFVGEQPGSMAVGALAPPEEDPR